MVDAPQDTAPATEATASWVLSEAARLRGLQWYDSMSYLQGKVRAFEQVAEHLGYGPPRCTECGCEDSRCVAVHGEPEPRKCCPDCNHSSGAIEKWWASQCHCRTEAALIVCPVHGGQP